MVIFSLSALLVLAFGAYESFQYFTRPRPPAGVALSAYKPPPEHPMTRQQAAEQVMLATVALAPRPRIRLGASDETALPMPATIGGADPSLTTASAGMARPAGRADGAGEGEGKFLSDLPSPADNPAYRIPLARVGLPLLEQQRVKEVVAAPSGIKIVTGFPCSEKLQVTKVSPTHFVIDMDTQHVFRNWFLFHVEGITKPTAIRIDLANSQLWKWSTLNPVYSYVTDLNDPASFATTPVKDPHPTVALNGPILPDTSGQKWHFISQIWIDQSRPHVGTLYTVQTFEKDAYVAMKYPYTPGYNHAWLASLKGNPHVKVMTVGKSAEGRPLQIVQIGDGDPTKTPCVLIYAREHSNEQDGSWLVQGAAEFLCSDDGTAKDIRARYAFILIPLLDPDGAINSNRENITETFTPWSPSPEAVAYSNFFKAQIDSGRRLDLVIDLHNLESAEGPDLLCAQMEKTPTRRVHCLALHSCMLDEFQSNGYSVQEKPWGFGESTRRLGGWLAMTYGSIFMPYEINSQEGRIHLSLRALVGFGSLTARAVERYFGSADFRTGITEIDAIRKSRNARWQARHTTAPSKNAIYAEAKCKWESDQEAKRR
jgi:hypothetical protein